MARENVDKFWRSGLKPKPASSASNGLGGCKNGADLILYRLLHMVLRTNYQIKMLAIVIDQPVKLDATHFAKFNINNKSLARAYSVILIFFV